MTLDTWRRTLDAIRDYHDLVQSRLGAPVTSELVLHGGEPLALPLDYLEHLMSEKEQLFAKTSLSKGGITLGMQTNLNRLSPGAIEFLKRHRFDVGVSMDFIGGVRRSLAGRETEATVLRNMELLREHEIPFGIITVLAKHTHDHLLSIYDFCATRGISWRVLPLFPGPNARPMQETFHLTNEQIVESLCKLFVHWMSSEACVGVEPLYTWLTAALRERFGATPTQLVDDFMESVFVVDPEGRVFHVNDEQEDSFAMGSVNEHSIEELLVGDARRRSLERRKRTVEKCDGCEFRESCRGAPLLQGPHVGSHRGRCPIAYPVYQFMETYLRESDMQEELTTLLVEQVSSHVSV